MRWIQYTDVAISICNSGVMLPLVPEPVPDPVRRRLRTICAVWVHYICHDCTFTLWYQRGKFNSLIDIKTRSWDLRCGAAVMLCYRVNKQCYYAKSHMSNMCRLKTSLFRNLHIQ